MVSKILWKIRKQLKHWALAGKMINLLHSGPKFVSFLDNYFAAEFCEYMPEAHCVCL